MPDKRSVTILGAGLVGSLLAILLRRRGYEVAIYERRADMRKAATGAGRSINLAMSTRGWHALQLAGLKEEMETLAIPMTGRYLHQPDGSTAFQPYGKNGEAIYSVSRGELNKRLMTLAEKSGAHIHFNQRCARVDVAANTVYLEEVTDAGNTPSNAVQSEIKNQKSKITADLLFGADGAFSALRTSYSYLDRVSARQDYIEYGYKELSIAPGEAGAWRIEKGALHIWPRGVFMLIALPNMDGSFTCTLFMPFDGESGFAHLAQPENVIPFFQKHFPDIVTLIPDFAEQLARNPTASLITTHISKWKHEGSSALIGDAAHAIVPFYGQGMNAGFEDCSVLDGLMQQYGDDWTTILDQYQQQRKPAGDAVADLALNNFTEMRDKVADPHFLERKRIEKELGKQYPEKFVSVYEMVSFSHTPYQTALRCTEAQDELLGRIMQHADKSQVTDEAAYQKAVEEWIEEYHGKVKELDFGK